jgi:acyl-CoA synthetase (NDP forming)
MTVVRPLLYHYRNNFIKEGRPVKTTDSLDFLFHPQSVAIAGVSEDVNKFNAGLKYLESLKEFGFKGKIYPVNPTGGMVMGMKLYKSVKDIPGTVDFVISAIPARYTPQLVADSVEKGVKAIHFFTSGFAEIENVEGKRLQAEIIGKAKRGGIRVVGPNCLGIYCPSGGLSFIADFEKTSGPVGLISQSGGNAAHCVHEGNGRGVYFSKVISMGNGADLNESDYLEYMVRDRETRIITGYIEGVRQGPRFFQALKAASEKKPVILLKVGTSGPGAEAAVSHTTALAGSNAVWDGVLKQAGVIRANSIEEMMDITLALQHMPAPGGNRIVITGIGGGASVILADEFTNAGLVLPRLSDKLRQSLIALYASEAGRIFKNPVDLNNFESPSIFFKTVQALDKCAEADILAIHVAFDHFGLISIKDKEFMIGIYLKLISQVKKEVKKPVAIILHSYTSIHTRKLAYDATRDLTEAGFAVFPSIQRAAAALGKYVRYHEKRRVGGLSR